MGGGELDMLKVKVHFLPVWHDTDDIKHIDDGVKLWSRTYLPMAFNIKIGGDGRVIAVMKEVYQFLDLSCKINYLVS